MDTNKNEQLHRNELQPEGKVCTNCEDKMFCDCMNEYLKEYRKKKAAKQVKAVTNNLLRNKIRFEETGVANVVRLQAGESYYTYP